MTDYGHSCGKDQDCTLPNIHCAYPNCYKGKQQATQTTDADIDRAILASRECIGYNVTAPICNGERAIYRAGFAAGLVAQAQIRIPTDTMEQEFAKYERRGYAAGIEAAAKVCDEYSQAHWHDYKHGVEEIRGNPYIEGKSDGADECAAAIRALKDAS